MRLMSERFAYGVPTPAGAGTPSPLPGPEIDDALETIEFGAALELVAGYAAGPLGARRIRERRPAADLGWIERELAMAGEVAELFRTGDGMAAFPVPDVTAALARLGVEGSVLGGRDLARLRATMAAARQTAQDLRRVADRAPLAATLEVPLPDRRLEKRLEESVDDEGQLLDTASPRLAAARREVQAARQRLIKRLESVLRSLDPQSTSPEATVTVRNGRYVIPVRRDSRTRPGGIIHDESGSHGTLFVEPSEAIELGNALREAEVEEERETLRVLRELTDLLRPEQPVLRDAFEMCVQVDDLVARGRYAAAHDGYRPAVDLAPAPFVIRHGRHPLLLAAGQPAVVVPFDLVLDPAERTLLISGPNTGGKTVLLKAAALASALAQSGIIPPVGPETRLPVFRRFFADIGDRQSIAASLSTFSAHVAMLRRVLDGADHTTLVLLDEVGSGTDPAEGTALAEAVLLTLTRRGAMTLATTHLGALKNLASHEAGIVNGSLQFDAATLAPTYRFVKGVPGRSYGLAIARRLGVAEDVLREAERRVPDAERSLDALLATVEQRERELWEKLAAAEARAVDLDALGARLELQRAALEAREAEVSRREKDAERAARKQAREFLMDARQRVEDALAMARVAVDEARAREARRVLEEGIAAERERLDALETAERKEPPAGADGAVHAGATVRVAAAGTGRVLELRPDGKAVVALGAMKITVKTADLTPIRGEPARKEPAAAPTFAAASAPLEIDLRGLTGAEAEQATLAALDAAVLAENPCLRIIHGMGTGVVRDRVRRVLAADRRVAKYDFAPRNQGGTGVTIVEFTG